MALFRNLSVFLISTCCLLVTLQGLSQDTITGSRQLFSLKPTTDFDQRFYYVPGERQNVWGYRLGALVNETYKLGIGGYYMNQNSSPGLAATALNRTSPNPLIISKKLYLGTVYYEPYLVRHNLWESSLVFESGYGRTVNIVVDKSVNTSAGSSRGIFIPAGVGLSVNLKLPALFQLEFLRWVGINAMVGYRAAVYQQDKQYKYNGAYWSISGAIFLDRIFEDYHKWKKIHDKTRSNRAAQLHY